MGKLVLYFSSRGTTSQGGLLETLEQPVCGWQPFGGPIHRGCLRLSESTDIYTTIHIIIKITVMK